MSAGLSRLLVLAPVLAAAACARHGPVLVDPAPPPCTPADDVRGEEVRVDALGTLGGVPVQLVVLPTPPGAVAPGPILVAGWVGRGGWSGEDRMRLSRDARSPSVVDRLLVDVEALGAAAWAPTTPRGLAGAVRDVFVASAAALFDVRRSVGHDDDPSVALLRRFILDLPHPLPPAPMRATLAVAGPVEVEATAAAVREALQHGPFLPGISQEDGEALQASRLAVSELRQELHPGFLCGYDGETQHFGRLEAVCQLGGGALRGARALGHVLGESLRGGPGIAHAGGGVFTSGSGVWNVHVAVDYRGPFDVAEPPGRTSAAELRAHLTATLAGAPALVAAARSALRPTSECVPRPTPERPLSPADLGRLAFAQEPDPRDEELAAYVANCRDTLIFEEWTFNGERQ